jgi:cytochrome c oxidase subunit III
MATTVQPPIVRKPGSGGVRRVQSPGSDAPSTGIWVGLAAITMTFAAFTSAMVVREGSGGDWRHFSLPTILYLNTAVLLVSSIVLQLARRRFASTALLADGSQSVSRAFYGTGILGLMFIFGQYAAWVQLRSEGLYVASSPNSSFFYVFTVLHALHVLGGLAGLLYVISKFKRGALRTNTLDAAARYWHFMGALWIYLFFLLMVRI